MNPKGLIVVADRDATNGSARPGTRVEALEYVANRPIAHHVLEALVSAGIDEIVVAAPAALASETRECLEMQENCSGVSLQYVHSPGTLDLGHALSLAAPIIGSAPCVVHLASGLLGEPLAPLVERLAGDAPDLVVVVHQGSGSDEHLSEETQEMLHLVELDPERAPLGMTGLCLFGPDALRHVSDAAWHVDGEVDLTTVSKQITAAGGTLDVRLVDAWRRYSGNPLDLLELNRIALDRLDTNLHRPSNNGNRIEGRVQIHESASVHASVIVGPTVIGPGAHVADAYIGPYTSVGAGARIEGAEIERSIIGTGASVMHVGGRLVSSVVGRDARVFRDFSLPRAMRLRVGDGTEVALC